MDFLSKQKITNLLIIILVVMNIASLSFIWYRQLGAPPRPQAPPPPPPAEKRVNDFLESQLNLTAGQQKQFQEIRKEHANRTHRMKENMGRLRRQILTESFADKPDLDKIENLAGKIGDIQKRYEEFLSEHFRKLNEVCTPEQRVILKEIFISSLAPPPPPPTPREEKSGNIPPPPPPEPREEKPGNIPPPPPPAERPTK